MTVKGKSNQSEVRRVLAVLRNNWLLLGTILLVPISYLPHELTSSRWSPTYLYFAAIVATGIKTGVLRKSSGPVIVALWVLGIWSAVDLVLLSIGSVPVSIGSVSRELLTILAAVILFKVAQQPEYKQVVVYGLRCGLVFSGAMGIYQYFIGLDALVSLGYGYGFFYSTAGGDYRPFGTFFSPTVYGGFIAMLGIAVVATIRRSWLKIPVAAGVFAVLLMTETRSGIIGFVIAGVVITGRGTANRATAYLATVFLGFVAAITLLFWQPGFVASSFARLSTAADSDDTSSLTRQAIWAGIVDALNDNGAWLSGLDSEFYTTLTPYVGMGVAGLGHAHSNYFQELYRFGIPGLILFLALLATILYDNSRCKSLVGMPYSSAGLAAVVVFMVDSIFNNSLSSLNVFTGLLVMAGLGSHPSTPRGQQEDRQDVTREKKALGNLALEA